MVHDDPADVGLTIKAQAFLRRGRGLAKSPRPDLIVLDLDMTTMNRREFLEEMRGGPDLKAIPVVVFGHSETPVDKTRSDARGALEVKNPLDLAAFMEALAEIVDLPQIRWAKRSR